MDGHTHRRVPQPHSTRANIVFTVALLLGIAAAWYLRDVVMLIYASVLFAVLLMPMVERCEKIRFRGKPVGRGVGIAILIVGGIVALALVLEVLLPPVWTEGNALIESWPARTAAMLDSLHRHALLRNFDFSQLQKYATEAGGWALLVGQRVAAGLAAFFTVLLLTLYLLVDGEEALHWSLRFMAPGNGGRLLTVLNRAQMRMRGWLVGQATLALILGVSSAIVFAALRLNYFYVLALLAGLLNFVPILGPFTAALIATVVAGMDSWPKLVGVLAFFAVYQIVENAWLTPRIMKNAVDLPALAVIVALAIGGAVAGVLGAVLAIPSAALVAELLNEYAVR